MSPAAVAETLALHSDCTVDRTPQSWNHARLVLRAHASHGAACLQTLAAGAYVSGLDDAD